MTTALRHDVTLSELRVRVLGGFDIDGVTSAELGSRKARTVLKLLVLMHGQGSLR